MATPATSKPVTFSDLRQGTVELGHGIKLSPVMRNGHVVAIRFEHEIQDYGETPIGTCAKVLPLGRQHRLRSRLGTWSLKAKRDEPISLSPSCDCPDHMVHGWIKDGTWLPMRVWTFGSLTQEELAYRIAYAEDRIREFGGGYEGAVLALAARAPFAYKSRKHEEQKPRRLFRD